MRHQVLIHPRSRGGFTLVELLVAMALTMFIMMILSQAFVTSLDTFAGLKAIGDLQAALRSAGSILQADLAAYHFEGSRRLRDPDIITTRPRQGFFAVYQGSHASLNPANSAYVDEAYELSTTTCATAVVLPASISGSGAVTLVTPVYVGSGYPATPAPVVTIVGGGGSGATASANLTSTPSGFTVTSFTIINGGSGYSSPPLVIIAPPPASTQSYRAGNHALHFTVKAIGNRPESVYSASVPASPNLSPLLSTPTNYFGQGTDAVYQPALPTPPTPAPATWFFNSQWAEVCYFLMPTGTTDFPDTPGATGGTPLFALYRGQYLLVPNPLNANLPANQPGLPSSAQYPNVSCYGPGPVTFNAPEDVAIPANRVFVPNPLTPVPTAPFLLNPFRKGEPPTGAPPYPLPKGSAQVLTNVVSFQVQLLMQPPGTQVPGMQLAGAPLPPAGPEFTDPVHDPATPNVWAAYDSSLSNYNVLAVKVTLRIFDPTSKQTRQITIVQDM